MNPLAAVAVKTVGAAAIAALLSVGSVSAFAASPSPTPKPTAGATQPSTDRHADRRAIRRAEVEAEADVLGITPKALIADLRAGQKVADLAKDKGMTKEQFETRLIASLKARLETAVEPKGTTQTPAHKTPAPYATRHVPY